MKKHKPTNWDDVPIVMTISDVCLILGRTRQTVSKMLVSGEIKARKSGNDWYISKENVKEFLKEV